MGSEYTATSVLRPSLDNKLAGIHIVASRNKWRLRDRVKFFLAMETFVS